MAVPPMASSSSLAAQHLGDGDGVDRLAPAVEPADGVEDVAVGRLVEVVADEADLGGGGDGVLRQQHGAEQRLLGREVVGRDPRSTPRGRRG